VDVDHTSSQSMSMGVAEFRKYKNLSNTNTIMPCATNRGES
jgi:hypothetical protein